MKITNKYYKPYIEQEENINGKNLNILLGIKLQKYLK